MKLKEEHFNIENEMSSDVEDVIPNYDVGMNCGESLSNTDPTDSSRNDDADTASILKVLLHQPINDLLLEKPSAIRTDKMFTLNSKDISIKSTRPS